MEEKTYIEILESFAKENALQFHTNLKVKKSVIIPSEKLAQSEYFVFDIPYNDNNLHLIFSDRNASGVGAGSSYCGLFLKIADCKNEVKVRRRFFTDTLSLEKRFKTGNSFTDKKVSIFCSSKERLPIKTDTGIIRKFIDINKAVMPMELVSIKNSLSFIPVLHGKDWLALVINRSWLLDSKKLKVLVKQGSELLLKANNSHG